MTEEVVRLRKAKNWSQDNLATEAHLSRNIISAIENGKDDILMSTVEKLAMAFGQSLPQFVQSPIPETLDKSPHASDYIQLRSVLESGDSEGIELVRLAMWMVLRKSSR